MSEIAKAVVDYAWLVDLIKTISVVGAALLAIKGWVVKPIKETRDSVAGVKASMDRRLKDYDERLDDFTASQKTLMHDQLDRQMGQDCVLNFLVSDRLATAHDYWMRKGYCPEPDRSRLKDMYNAHRMRGQNHLSESFLDDLDALPKSTAEPSGDKEMAINAWRKGNYYGKI